MHGTILKSEPAERHLLDRQATRLRQAWLKFIRRMRSKEALAEMQALFERKDVAAISRVLDYAILTTMQTPWETAATEAASFTQHKIAPKLGKAAPTVSTSFVPGDPRAADLMRRQKLEFVSNLTLQQRNTTRRALEAGIRAGLGSEALARTFRDSIGLLPAQQQSLTAFERSMRAGRSEEMARPEGERGPTLTDAQIAQRVERQRTGFLQARAEVIARTEALAVVSTAQDIALRESLRDTGIEQTKVFKIWNTTRDGRERPEHAARDGMRIPLNDSFAPGIQKPGDGPAREAIGCRCVLTYEFED